MTLTEQVIMIILAVALALFLILAIILVIKLMKVVNNIRDITESTKKIATNIEETTNHLKKITSPIGFINAIKSLVENIKNRANKKEEYGEE
jgi:inner membrane protein involved in colicin E2 resistance